MRAKSLVAFVVMGVMMIVGHGSSAYADPLKDFKPLVYKNDAGKTIPYRLFIPAGYDGAKKFPLVLFFHGAGERGDDNALQLKFGVDAFSSESFQREHPCIIIAPQCPTNAQWVNVPWGADSEVQPAEPSEHMQLALAVLDQTLEQFSVDTNRIYVTGMSMGGFATWDVITRYPDRFAAAVPICGGGDEKKAPLITKLPIWVFHGSDDTIVKTIRSRNMVQAVKIAGGNCRYTEYPGVGHICFPLAFGDKEMLNWMFAQKKSQ